MNALRSISVLAGMGRLFRRPRIDQAGIADASGISILMQGTISPKRSQLVASVSQHQVDCWRFLQ